MVRLNKIFGLRARRRFVDVDNQELDAMYEDDTIDIKNFGRMDEGPAKDEFREMLTERMNWYIKQRLSDWAEQIHVALWIDETFNKGEVNA